MNKEKHFWITNISNKYISIDDLGIRIKPFASINLLSNHYHYTENEINLSLNKGSIFKKRKSISVRINAPEKRINTITISELSVPSRTKSIIEVNEVHYEELDIANDDDLKYAEENAETALRDEMPIWKKD